MIAKSETLGRPESGGNDRIQWGAAVRRVVAFSLTVVVASGVARLLAELALILRFVCPFHAITGLPCPFCGGTRAVALITSGSLIQAFLTNPLVVVAIVGLLTWGALSLVAPPVCDGLHRFLSTKKARTAAVIALGANWLYLIAAGR